MPPFMMYHVQGQELCMHHLIELGQLLYVISSLGTILQIRKV